MIPELDASGKIRNTRLTMLEKRQRYKNNRKKREIALVKRLENFKNPSDKNLDLNRPYVPITIYNRHYSGLADTGSDVNLIGSKIFQNLKCSKAKRWHVNKKLQLADGTTRVSSAIELPIKWINGILKVTFFVVSDDSNEILLGRPFLKYANIGILPDGYFSTKKPQKIFKFAPSPSAKMKSYRVTLAEKREIYQTIKQNIHNDETGMLNKILSKFTSAGLFSEKIGLVKGITASIQMKDSLPYRAQLRPLNDHTKQIVNEELDNWLAQNIIAPVEPGEAKFVSPIHVVKKKKLPGEEKQGHRVVVDQRCLNSRCIVEPPLNPPRADLIFTKMAKAKYFSKIDLKSAYLQVSIEPKSRPYFCFNTHRGIFQFQRTPFGHVNSGKIFNDVMEKILHGINRDLCENFYDDIYIFTDDLETHAKILEEVLSKILNSGMTVNYKKVSIADTQIEALGHFISKGLIKPDESKVASVKQFPIPKTKKDVQRFLGFANFFSKFIKDFQIIAAPLTHLIRKNTKFIWSIEAHEAFEQIKTALISSDCILHLPDMSKEFFLFVDASAEGYGGILTQLIDEHYRPIFFLSRKTSEAERKFCATELECGALLFCISKLSPYLQHSKFTVFTDHCALKNLLTMPNPSGRVKRWALYLCGLNCRIVYKPGKTNIAADTLSRHAVLETTDFPIEPTPRDEIICAEDVECEGKLEFDDIILNQIKHACTKCASDEVTAKYKTQIQTMLVTPPFGVKAQTTNKISTTPEQTTCEMGSQTERKQRGRKPMDKPSVRKQKQFSKRRYTTQQIIPTPGEIKMSQRLKSFVTQNINLSLPQTDADWIHEQEQDIEIMHLKEEILKKNKEKYSISDTGVIKFTANDKNLIVLPKHLRKTVLEICHNDILSAHPGQHVTFIKIASCFVWKGMRKDINEYVAGCRTCQQVKPSNSPKLGLYNAHIETQINECVVTDLIGPLPRTSSGFEYIIVISCEFTRWTEFYPMRTATTKNIIAKLHDYFCRLGFARKLKSDNASVYKSKMLSEYCDRFEIQQVFINSYKARENCAERRIRDLKIKLKTYAANNHKTWDKYLVEIGFALRTSVCQSTNFTPAMLMLNRELQHPLLPRRDTPIKSTTQFVQDIVQQMDTAHNTAIERIATERKKSSEKFNTGRKNHSFNVGNIVWRKTNILSSADKKIAASLAPKRDGPFQIARILGKNSVMLETLDGKPAGKRHTEDLKLFVGQPYWAI